MLIVKNFHDYYDSAIGFGGVDKTCVYNRSPKQEKDKYEMNHIHKIFEGDKGGWTTDPYCENHSSYRWNKPKQDAPWLITPFIIGFCGKTYVGYVLRWDGNGEVETKIVYGPEAFFDLHPFNLKEKYGSSKNNYERTVKYFEKFHNKEHSELFVKYNNPVWVYDFGTDIIKFDDIETYNRNEKHFYLNPILNNYQFYQIFDAPTAFQEIQMYLQGVLGSKEKDTVEISDKDKLLQHGFDPKWSFRNPCPPQRKKGKCKI